MRYTIAFQAIEKMTVPEQYFPGQTPTTDCMVKPNGHLATSLDPPHWHFDFEVWDTARSSTHRHSDVSIVTYYHRIGLAEGQRINSVKDTDGSVS